VINRYPGKEIDCSLSSLLAVVQTIDKLGKAGEVVKVAPGHFRNHLMPKMLAVPNIDKFAILIRSWGKQGRW
jgi:signal recognition particle GTPase